MSDTTKAHWKIESGVNIVATRKMLGIVDSAGIKAFSYPEYARLIAAAPDMLKVLEAIHAHLVNGDRCYTLMVTMAEQAIAKAKGRIAS
jgi:hypothetical protein